MKSWNDLYNKYPFIRCPIECGIGWNDLIDLACDFIDIWYTKYHPDELKDFFFTQIKEKYGTLRLYSSNSYDEVFDFLSLIEERSATICEICGKDGETKESHGWYKTVCPECFELWDKRYDSPLP